VCCASSFADLEPPNEKREWQADTYDPPQQAKTIEEAIMALVAVPGERWEIEFLSDGSVEVEKFISTGEIYGAKSLSELFARYTNQEENAESSTGTEVMTSAAKST
jgi:hypothetical protein